MSIHHTQSATLTYFKYHTKIVTLLYSDAALCVQTQLVSARIHCPPAASGVRRKLCCESAMYSDVYLQSAAQHSTVHSVAQRMSIYYITHFHSL